MKSVYQQEIDLIDEGIELLLQQPKLKPETLAQWVEKLTSLIGGLPKRRRENEVLEVSLLSFGLLMIMFRMMLEIKQELLETN